MWTTAIVFPDADASAQDAAGFINEKKSYTAEIPACEKDLARQDEILANQEGYTADLIVEIDAAAYNGAGFFVNRRDGYEYDIKRTFRKEKSSRIQLTAKRREHGRI